MKFTYILPSSKVLSIATESQAGEAACLKIRAMIQ